jgi:hypothetical protein
MGKNNFEYLSGYVLYKSLTEFAKIKIQPD